MKPIFNRAPLTPNALSPLPLGSIRPEDWLGVDFLAPAEGRAPEESLARILGHLAALLPDVGEAALRRELK